MSQKTDQFISTLAPIARNEYLSRDKWVLPSICIAQAAIESGWNLNAKTLFGIKGKGFTASTSEYYNGHYEQITASFKSYPTVASAVVGYYDLITKNSRYAKAVNNKDYESAVKAIKDGGYATDPNYVSKVVSIINQYGLLKYDDRSQPKKSNEEIAGEIIAGKWGTNPDRAEKLKAAGYDPTAIQSIVNAKMGVKPAPVQPKKTNEQIADEVIAGKWGVNPARTTALKNAGYDPTAIQQIVNYKLGTTKAKSNTEIAREVIAGKWGKGAERRRLLTANGYDYNAIQRIVNSLLK